MTRRHLTCASCGNSAGLFEQWHNRDTGYGVCAPCVDWLKQCGYQPKDLQHSCGTEGVHYAAARSEGGQP